MAFSPWEKVEAFVASARSVTGRFLRPAIYTRLEDYPVAVAEVLQE
jgi:hypothetical protein